MAVFGSRVGSVPRDGRWWFAIAGGHSAPYTVAFYAGAALLILGWLGLGTHAWAGRLSVRQAWGVLAAWGLPLFLGPPLFSRDLYSYVGQGLVASHGLDPYSVAPSVLGNGPVLASIATVWRDTASPYGPLFVALGRIIAGASGGGLVTEVLAFRALELLGVALIMVFLPRLARRAGAPPPVALWIGALSPLALFGFVASGHNDALMVGLVVAGIALALEGRLWLGVALCALAATVKLPAAAAVAFLAAFELAGPAGDRWRGRRRAAGAVALGAAVLVAVTLAAGYGFAWLGPGALRIPTELRIQATPAVSVGIVCARVLHLLGARVTQGAVVSAIQIVSGVVVAAGLIWLAWRVRRHGVTTSIGYGLVLVVLGSPTLWPWYLLWGTTLLGATAASRSKVLIATVALAMFIVGPSGHPLLTGDAFVAVTAATVAGCAYVAHTRRWRTIAVGDVD